MASLGHSESTDLTRHGLAQEWAIWISNNVSNIARLLGEGQNIHLFMSYLILLDFNQPNKLYLIHTVKLFTAVVRELLCKKSARDLSDGSVSGGR